MANPYGITLDDHSLRWATGRARDGRKLTDYWSSGLRTLHGFYSHGFPNCFFAFGPRRPLQRAMLPRNVIDSPKQYGTWSEKP